MSKEPFYHQYFTMHGIKFFSQIFFGPTPFILGRSAPLYDQALHQLCKVATPNTWFKIGSNYSHTLIMHVCGTHAHTHIHVDMPR